MFLAQTKMLILKALKEDYSMFLVAVNLLEDIVGTSLLLQALLAGF